MALTFMHIIGIFNYVRFEVHKYVIKSDAASGLVWPQFDMASQLLTREAKLQPTLCEESE